MCINSQTSLAAFLIGESSGLLLLNSNKIEKKIIGFFIMFYSLVQLMEYNIYNNNNSEISSKLLLTNLGMQGIVLFLLLNTLCKIDNIYLLLPVVAFLYIMYTILFKSHKKATVNNCIKWDFMTFDIKLVLHFMYLSIFHLLFFNKCLFNNLFIRKTGYFFLITCIISFIIGNTTSKGPSFWCLSSALLSPLLVLT